MKQNKKKFLIVIDGPSGSGKSTLANLVGKKFRCPFCFPVCFIDMRLEILEKNPKKIYVSKENFQKLNYKKLRRLNLHSTKISSYTSEIAKDKKIRNIVTNQFQKVM